jgi:hypothetical protein
MDEFLFYPWNFVRSGITPRLGWFFHLSKRDPILWMIFAIGCPSFLACAYFLALILIWKRDVV